MPPTLSAASCPYFILQQEYPEAVIALVYQGSGNGYAPLTEGESSVGVLGGARAIDLKAVPMTLAAVKALARTNPLGA